MTLEEMPGQRAVVVYLLWDRKEYKPEQEMGPDNSVSFFNAFGYVINRDLLVIEAKYSPRSFSQLPAPKDSKGYGKRTPKMRVEQAVQLIDDPKSWLQKYRAKTREEGTALWFADRLVEKPTAVLQAMYDSPGVEAGWENGTYRVRGYLPLSDQQLLISAEIRKAQDRADKSQGSKEG